MSKIFGTVFFFWLMPTVLLHPPSSSILPFSPQVRRCSGQWPMSAWGKYCVCCGRSSAPTRCWTLWKSSQPPANSYPGSKVCIFHNEKLYCFVFCMRPPLCLAALGNPEAIGPSTKIFFLSAINYILSWLTSHWSWIWNWNSFIPSGNRPLPYEFHEMLYMAEPVSILRGERSGSCSHGCVASVNGHRKLPQGCWCGQFYHNWTPFLHQ